MNSMQNLARIKTKCVYKTHKIDTVMQKLDTCLMPCYETMKYNANII